MQLGIDIGGSHVGIGVVDEKGNILKKQIMDYDGSDISADDIFEFINEFISKNKQHNFKSIGIGVPGISSGTVINYTCNLPFNNVDVAEYINTDIPIYISNDANCATIAEYEIADKRFYSNYALVTFGTGIGSGMILNGELYKGSTGSAGELGHIVIEKNGLPCKCGRRGCFEQYASITALKRMTCLESLKEIFYLSERNESIQKTLDEYIENMAEGLVNFVNLYDFEMLVIGGSLANYSNSFMYKLKAKMMSKIYNKYTCDLNIKSATLGNDAGIIGASLLHKYEQQER